MFTHSRRWKRSHGHVSGCCSHCPSAGSPCRCGQQPPHSSFGSTRLLSSAALKQGLGSCAAPGGGMHQFLCRSAWMLGAWRQWDSHIGTSTSLWAPVGHRSAPLGIQLFSPRAGPAGVRPGTRCKHNALQGTASLTTEITEGLSPMTNPAFPSSWFCFSDGTLTDAAREVSLAHDEPRQGRVRNWGQLFILLGSLCTSYKGRELACKPFLNIFCKGEGKLWAHSSFNKNLYVTDFLVSDLTLLHCPF